MPDDWFQWACETESATLPAGFALLPETLDLNYEEIRDAIAWEQRSMTFPTAGTIPLPRLTAMYGSAYTYSGIAYPAKPLPSPILAVARKVEEITGIFFNSVLGNLYRDGRDSVSWHSDDDYHFLRPEIASVSIGATRRFRVRRKSDHTQKFHLDLTHGSVLVMSGQSQRDWEHCVPKTEKPVEPRINLTFRSIRP